eukprot:6024903-Amphidinium_carterae.1
MLYVLGHNSTAKALTGARQPSGTWIRSHLELVQEINTRRRTGDRPGPRNYRQTDKLTQLYPEAGVLAGYVQA